MKFQITFKTPDVVSRTIAENMLTDIEPQVRALVDRFIEHGEYITIEFNLKSGTASVVEKK